MLKTLMMLLAVTMIPNSWVGTWKGNVDNLPFVKLVLDRTGGSITFYVIGNGTIAGETTVTLEEVKATEQSIHFVVDRPGDHQRIKLMVKREGKDEAVISHVNPGETDKPLKLTRE